MNKQETDKQIQEQLFAYLNEGKKITLHWDCGGDEAFVYTVIDGTELSPFENEKYVSDSFPALLEHFIITKLYLPDAGEFSMKGQGEILLEDNKIVVVYETLELTYEDWNHAEDAETENKGNETQESDVDENEYSNNYVNASPEEYAEYSGKKVLFQL